MRKRIIAVVAILSCGVALAIAWPVNEPYDGSAEASNVSAIQRMGYHAIMRAGKVYKFKFSDGTTAYFIRMPGLSNYKFQQVSEAEYADNPGADYDPNSQTNSLGGGGGDSGEGFGSDEFLTGAALAEWVAGNSGSSGMGAHGGTCYLMTARSGGVIIAQWIQCA